MDITIHTTTTDEVDVAQVRDAVEALNYFVDRVEVAAGPNGHVTVLTSDPEAIDAGEIQGALDVLPGTFGPIVVEMRRHP